MSSFIYLLMHFSVTYAIHSDPCFPGFDVLFVNILTD